jgi:hypothetical protein
MPSGVRHSVRGVRRRILEVPFRDLADPFAILLSDELTHEAEDALTEEAKNPPPDTGPADSTSTSDPHTQDVKGLNKAPLGKVEDSNPARVLDQLITEPITVTFTVLVDLRRREIARRCTSDPW